MTDIHCHILPGVDDGASDAAESGLMLDLAAETGTSAMVATPHADLRYRFEPERCRQSIARLREENSAGPRLYLGCELHLTPENISKAIADPPTYTLNGAGYILLELPDRVLPPMVEPAIQALADAGLRVIIAHPERNPFIQHQPSYAAKLVEAGCYLQLTARSLNGGFGTAAASTATYLLKRQLAHFVASDAHGSVNRKPGLAAAFDHIAKTHGEAAAQILFVTNPSSAVTGAPIRHMPSPAGWLSSLFARTTNGFRKQTVSQLP